MATALRNGNGACSPGCPEDGKIAGRLTLDGCELVVVRDEAGGRSRAADAAYDRVGSLQIDDYCYVVYRCRPADNGAGDPIGRLTPRELEIAVLIAAGEVNKAIARKLRISPFTVGAHINRIFCKTGVRSRAALSAQLVHRLGKLPI